MLLFLTEQIQNKAVVLKMVIFAGSLFLVFLFLGKISVENDQILALPDNTQKNNALADAFDTKKMHPVFLSMIAFLFCTTFMVFV